MKVERRTRILGGDDYLVRLVYGFIVQNVECVIEIDKIAGKRSQIYQQTNYSC